MRILALYAITLIFTTFGLGAISMSISPHFAMPLFEAMLIYYFAIHRARIFDFWFIFLIGIWSDLIVGTPLGLTAFTYLIATKLYQVITQRQLPKENFVSVLLEFAILCLLLLLRRDGIVDISNLFN